MRNGKNVGLLTETGMSEFVVVETVVQEIRYIVVISLRRQECPRVILVLIITAVFPGARQTGQG